MGRLLRNDATGEEVAVVAQRADVLVLETTWTRPGHRAAPHVHPTLEERFEVLEGRAGFVVDGVESVAGPGEVVVAPPGATHVAWNAREDDGPTRVRLEFRPPGRWLEVVERLFAGESPLVLLREYPDELAPPSTA
jgi:quercetin dioxygenase-like cupin family protein